MSSQDSRVLRVCNTIDGVNLHAGQMVAWLTIVMVVIQLLVVLLRYVFGFGAVFLQESILYLHSTVFLCGAGYTLLKDAHVRVDAFYHNARRRNKAIINAVGCICFLGSFIGALSVFSFPYVMEAWEVMEGSRETTGIPAVFLLKTLILVYAFLLALQGTSLFLKSYRQIFLELRS